MQQRSHGHGLIHFYILLILFGPYSVPAGGRTPKLSFRAPLYTAQPVPHSPIPYSGLPALPLHVTFCLLRQPPSPTPYPSPFRYCVVFDDGDEDDFKLSELRLVQPGTACSPAGLIPETVALSVPLTASVDRVSSPLLVVASQFKQLCTAILKPTPGVDVAERHARFDKACIQSKVSSPPPPPPPPPTPTPTTTPPSPNPLFSTG